MHVLQKLPFKKLFLGCCLIYGISPVFSQKNYIRAKENINKARYACYLSKWSVANKLYAANGNKKYLTDTDYYLWAKATLATGRKEKFHKLLNQSISSCGMVGHWIKKDQLFFQNYFTSNEIDSLISGYTAKELNCIDSSVQKLLEEIMDVDRKNRKLSKIDPEMDKQNQWVLLEYIKKNGFPDMHKSGGDFISTVLIHIDCSLINQYTSILLSEIYKRNLNPFAYAHMYDRIMCQCGFDKSKFNTYNTLIESCKVSIEEVIKNRNSIGLSNYLDGPASTPFHLGKPTNFIHDSVIFRK